MTCIKDESKPERSQPYELSIKSWSDWCDKNNHEFFVLDQFIFDPIYMRPNWYKLYVFDLLEENNIEYDNVLIADADTIVHPDCPNVFDIADGKFAAVPVHGSMDWVLRSIENYSKHLFDGYTFPFWKYINSGMLVVNDTHRQMYQDIIKFYFERRDLIVQLQDTFHVGTDQPIINFFMHKYWMQKKVECKFLSYKFNMQDMALKEILDEELTFTNIGWIYHYNAIPDNHDASKTLYWMQKTYDYFTQT